MSPRKYLKHLVLLAGLSLAGVVAGPSGAHADDVDEDAQLIIVRGSGEARVRPDSLRLDLGVEARAATLDQARDLVNRAMADVITAVRGTSIENLTLDTRVIQVNPVYGPHRADQPPTIIGFAASNHISVTVRRAPVEKLGDHCSRILDAALGAGANSVGGLELFLDDPAPAHDDALAAAVVDARHDAQTIAKAAGVTLVGLHSVEESQGLHLMTPRALSLQVDASTPVAIDDIVVQSDVTARFTFQ